MSGCRLLKYRSRRMRRSTFGDVETIGRGTQVTDGQRENRISSSLLLATF
jgi:hypothetical protein